MQITMKCVAVLALAYGLGVTSYARASQAGDDSLNALKQEVTQLKQSVAEITKCIERLDSLERAVSQPENHGRLVFPLDVETGTWIDDLEMQT